MTYPTLAKYSTPAKASSKEEAKVEPEQKNSVHPVYGKVSLVLAEPKNPENV